MSATINFVTFHENTLPIHTLARLSNIQPSTLRNRVAQGWDLDAAVVATPQDQISSVTSRLFASQPAVQQAASKIATKAYRWCLVNQQQQQDEEVNQSVHNVTPLQLAQQLVELLSKGQQ